MLAVALQSEAAFCWLHRLWKSQRELQHPYVKVMCLGCENLASNIHHHLWKKVPIAVSINNRVQGSGIQHLTPCFLKMILAVIPVRVGSEQLWENEARLKEHPSKPLHPLYVDPPISSPPRSVILPSFDTSTHPSAKHTCNAAKDQFHCTKQLMLCYKNQLSMAPSAEGEVHIGSSNRFS